MVVRSSSSGPQNPFVAAAVVTVLLVGIGLVIVFGLQQKAKNKAIQATWPTATAQVTQSGWQSFDGKQMVGRNVVGQGLNGPYEYVPTVSYAYGVAGQNFQNQVMFRAHNTKGMGALRDAQSISGRYAVGFQFTVRYNPKQPSQSVPDPELK